LAKKGNMKHDTAQEEQLRKPSDFAVPAVFLLIGIVYAVSLFVIFPNMPVTTRLADTIAGYDSYYPPFRTDEYNYYDIGKNIVDGTLYEEGSFERAYPLGFPLVASPFIAVLDKMGGYVANAVIMWLSVFLFYLVIKQYNKRIYTLSLVVIMAFATLNWFYAVSFYSEPLSQLLVILTVYLLARGKNAQRYSLLFVSAGIVTGLNLFVRPHYIVLAAPFFLSLLIGEKAKLSIRNKGVLYAGGVSAVIVLWLIRNSIVFDSPLTFEYTRMLAQFLPGNQPVGVKGNVFTGIHRLLFDEFHGLLTITPIILIFPVGLRHMWQRGLKNEAVTYLASVIVMMLIFASGPYPFTEFGLGSRHMMPLFPLMMIPAVFFIDEKAFSRGIVLILALYSFYNAGIGWFTGTYPGFGYLPGYLNDSHARAVILARKDVLPKRTFKSSDDLLKTHIKALDKVDLYTYLQTLSPETLKQIRGNERYFLRYWRQNQKDIRSKISSMDPARGIVYEGFQFVPQAPPAETPVEQNKSEH